MKRTLFLSTLIATMVMRFHIEISLAEGEHSHAHPAPHGGQVRELGDYHVEFVVSEHGQITVYLSDHDQTPLTVKDVQGAINLKVDSGFKRLNLKPNADATALEAEINLHEIHGFEAGVRLTINEKKYSNVVFKYVSHEEMPRKLLEAIFPNAREFVHLEATLSSPQIETIEKALTGYEAANAKISMKEKSVHVMIAEDAGHKIIGSALPLHLIGPNQGKIHGLVGINSDGAAISVALMEHHHKNEHDEHGEHYDNVEHTDFLKQFVGKTLASDLRIGKEIQAEEEVEVSAAIATSIKKALLVWNMVKDPLEDREHEHNH